MALNGFVKWVVLHAEYTFNHLEVVFDSRE
jgi:hypothetical protein